MLGHVASQLLELAKKLETGFLPQLQASAVFHAFTFEAYLNHGVSHEIESWKESHRDKLSLRSNYLKFRVDPGRRPFQTISSGKFRPSEGKLVGREKEEPSL